MLLLVGCTDATGSGSDSTQDEAKSSNANLSSLTVSTGTLTPAFSADITDYELLLPTSVFQVTVSGQTEDSAAVADNSQSNPAALNYGNNVLTVTVTAEDGTEKTYSINARRKPLWAKRISRIDNYDQSDALTGYTTVSYDTMTQCNLSHYNSAGEFLGQDQFLYSNGKCVSFTCYDANTPPNITAYGNSIFNTDGLLISETYHYNSFTTTFKDIFTFTDQNLTLRQVYRNELYLNCKIPQYDSVTGLRTRIDQYDDTDEFSGYSLHTWDTSGLVLTVAFFDASNAPLYKYVYSFENETALGEYYHL